MSNIRKVIGMLAAGMAFAGLAGCALQPTPEQAAADLENQLTTNPETGLLSPVDIERVEAKLARLHRP